VERAAGLRSYAALESQARETREYGYVCRTRGVRRFGSAVSFCGLCVEFSKNIKRQIKFKKEEALFLYGFMS
jgi:hypothetical protein